MTDAEQNNAISDLMDEEMVRDYVDNKENMHQAIQKLLTGENGKWLPFIIHLYREVYGIETPDPIPAKPTDFGAISTFRLVAASSRKQAAALIRTFGKWIDNDPPLE